MQRISVDLPAPDGPISPTTWPLGTSKDTSLSAVSPVLYVLPSPAILSIRQPLAAMINATGKACALPAGRSDLVPKTQLQV